MKICCVTEVMEAWQILQKQTIILQLNSCGHVKCVIQTGFLKSPFRYRSRTNTKQLTTTFTILTMRYSEIVFLITKLFHISTKSNAETICSKILYSVNEYHVLKP